MWFLQVKGSIETLVQLSKKGILANAGAVILEDFEFYSLRGSLSTEDLKTLFDVRDGGTVECKRYGTIDFPPGLPRLFGFNSPAKDLLGTFSPDSADMNSHTKAQLKRVMIAGYDEIISRVLITDEAKKRINDAMEAERDMIGA